MWANTHIFLKNYWIEPNRTKKKLNIALVMYILSSKFCSSQSISNSSYSVLAEDHIAKNNFNLKLLIWYIVLQDLIALSVETQNISDPFYHWQNSWSHKLDEHTFTFPKTFTLWLFSCTINNVPIHSKMYRFGW